ncbi:hypothetical protein COY29_01695 [Candidatus Woesebacteria bacterium CG_4_10_14_0_2_um_filter_39_14]|uniref:DUF2029 domain-containing protein n=3 Tax=Microgenomates group TaxID=1794810 RepID=A0A2M6YQL8_9BACT|nr:MAG: hypothetical protein COT04_00070 [Candidatus Shapirobacteria bacterium CG07_land_8_20_14_0_80_39_12]PIZ49501.1 MAG: hypothetical protein COY29_01695 [Candidatus Woesebacteria bacterium CG_4_10_14_0_2_um_filter_39_14]PJA49920.1 MAG: hypothetical protein CO169_00575 [Candidatus Shapirobacteria bacterium CG_4_9_14_3_um_filter_39_13]
MKKFLIKWILIGLALRLVLMPFTIHPDIRALDLGAFLISQKGQFLTFYDYLSGLARTHSLVSVYGIDLFIYPPLAYLTPAFFMAILSPFYNFSANAVFLGDMTKIFQTAEIFKIAFLLKLPYLLFDFLLAFLLLEIFKKKSQPAGRLGLRAFKIWMLNPVTLYATFAMGQFDIIPVLLIVAGIFFAFKDKKWLAVIMLGIGGAYKMFPLLFLPIFVLLLDKNFWIRLKLLVVGLLPYLLVITPYLLFSPMYRQAAFLANQTEKMLFMKLPLSGAEYLSVFLVGFFVLLMMAAKAKIQKDNFWRFGLVLMLLFFAVTHYHPQWFLWLTPFLVWLWLTYEAKYRSLIILLFGCWFILTCFFESSLHIGLFSPVWPDLLKSGGLTKLVSRFTDPFLIKSLIRSLFAAIALFLSFRLLSERKMSD